VSSIGAYVIGVGMLVLLWGVVSSWRRGRLAAANPWGSKTLEWTVPNPVPLENFKVLPVVIADPYGYGEGDPDSVHTAQEREAATVSAGSGPADGHRTEQTVGSSTDGDAS
jgi:cytochrome c oxidase subunit 1